MVEGEPYYLVAAEAAGGILALLTALAALRAYRVSRAEPLRLFASGFVGLSVAQFAAALLEDRTRSGEVPLGSFDHFDVLFWLYYVAMTAGLLLVFLSFGRHPFRWTPALSGVLLRAGPVAQFAVLIALFFVVLHAGLNHIARARAGSLQTAAGFFLLLVGQFVSLYGYAPLSPRTLYGEIASLAGYLLLFLAVARPLGTK